MTKATIYLLPETWKAFRMACLQHNTSASQQVVQLIEEQLQRWQHLDKAKAHG